MWSPLIGLILVVPTAIGLGPEYVGNFRGELSVEQGQAVYKLPIELPKGPQNIQPNLNLVYNSGSGNGLLGLGWAVDVLSVIARCPQTLAQDEQIKSVQYTADDRFCLDGQRLVSVNGEYGADMSEYRTEVDSHSKVVALGQHGSGPDSFRMWTKDGRILEYGASRTGQLIGENQTSIHQWNLNKITDRSNNYVTIVYISNTTFPSEIQYGTTTVLFQYEDRPDTTTAYFKGSILSRINRRLQRLEIKNRDLIRQYVFDYKQDGSGGSNQSLLSSVWLCDPNDACLKPLTFDYDDTEQLINSFEMPNNTIKEFGSGWSVLEQPRFIRDVNGDGLPDIVGFGSTCVYVALNDGKGRFHPGQCWVNAFGYTDTWRGVNNPRELADIDGDGLPDVVGFSSAGVDVSFNTGYSFRSPRTLLKAFGYGTGWRTQSHLRFVQDVNGDGRADILGFFNDGVEVAISKGHTFESKGRWSEQFGFNDGWRIVNHPRFLKDVNGDNLPDLVGIASGGVYVEINTGTSFTGYKKWSGGFSYSGGWRTEHHPRFIEDMNGDGLGDIVGFASGGVYVGLSTGESFTSAPNVLAKFGYSAGGWRVANHPRLLADVTADGLTDIIGFASGGVYVSYNMGNLKFSTPTLWVASFGYSAGGWRVASHPRHVTDVSGDGLADIVGFASNGVHVSVNKNKQPLIHQFIDSFESRQEISYATLPKAKQLGRYNKSVSVYPHLSLVSPMKVVTAVNHNQGTEASNRTEYSYSGLRVHLSGYGNQGFQREIKTDSNNRTVEKEWEQEFPLTGKVGKMRQSIKFQTHETVISETVMNYNVKTQNSVHDVTLAKEVTHTYELDGNEVSEIETTYTGTNGYGHPLHVVTRTTGGGQTFTKRTVNTYYSDADTWLISLITSSNVTHESPCVDSISRHTTYRYDVSTGHLTDVIVEPNSDLSLTTEFIYDAHGNVIEKREIPTKQKGHSRRTLTTFDENGIHKISTSNSMAHTESYGYDSMGNLVNLTGANGLRTTWSYDKLGRKVRENRADGTEISWSYNWDKSIPEAKYNIKMVSEGSPTKTRVYDSLDRIVCERSMGFSDNIFEDVRYNQEGLVSKHSYAHYSTDLTAWTTYDYDILGRLILKTVPGMNQMSAEHRTSYHGLKSMQVDALGHVTSIEKDVLGRLIKVRDDLGGTLQYKYDSVGNLVETVDTDGHSTVVTYDLLGYKSKVSEPNMGTWEYKHNAFGELIWQQDAKGNVLTQDYDTLGRLLKRTELEGSTTWEYDKNTGGLGKPSSVHSDDGYKRSWEYDEYGREHKVITSIQNRNYTIVTKYDPYGRINHQQYPNGESLYRNYTGQGYLMEVGSGTSSQASDSKLLWKALAYDALGRLKKEQYGNDLITDYEYDLATHLTGITTHKNGDDMIRHLHYSYDLNENLLFRQDLIQGVSESFRYDRLDRLTQSTVQSARDTYERRQNWDYYQSGNIRFNDLYGLGPFVYDPARPNAVIKAGNHTYAYDANGNAIQKDGKSIHWNSYNKPSRFETEDGYLTFKYGPDRRRYEQVSPNGDSNLYIDQTYEVETKRNVSKSKIFIYGAMGRLVGILSKNMSNEVKSVTYVHTDSLGSVDTVTNDKADIVGRVSYDAFGMKRAGNWKVGDTSTFDSIRGYTGHESLEEVGLVHMNGRVYDPDIGRFLSPDPHVQDPTNTQALNRYSYALNNPLKHNDPTGFFFKKLKRFVKKYWKPIVAAAVSAVTFGAATPIAAGLVATAGFTGTTAAVATGVLAGATSGFVGGTIVSGDVKGGLQGAVGGAVFGGIGGYFGGTWNVERVVSQATAGGVVTELGGGKFKDGFAVAGLAASARYLYNTVVGYDVDSGPGGAAEQKTQNQYPYAGKNNIGIQGKPPDPSWIDKDQFLGINWGEGGGVSRLLNRVPGINAVAGLHDVFQVELDTVFFPGARDAFNVPGMIPAAAITYTALRDGPGLPSLLVDETRKSKR